MSMFQDIYEALSVNEKHILDVLSVGAMVGTLADFLPHVAAGFTIVWTGIRIWETPTVQGLFGRVPKE
jgi:hypothetical protein